MSCPEGSASAYLLCSCLMSATPGGTTARSGGEDRILPRNLNFGCIKRQDEPWIAFVMGREWVVLVERRKSVESGGGVHTEGQTEGQSPSKLLPFLWFVYRIPHPFPGYIECFLAANYKPFSQAFLQSCEAVSSNWWGRKESELGHF